MPRLEGLELEEALARWLAPVLPLPEEAVPAPLSVGRVLSRPLTAWRALPAAARSAVEGYALRADELAAAASLPVAEPMVWAGVEAPSLPVGEAMFVATGALVPAGADTVVPIELAALSEHDGRRRLEATRTMARGANMRQAAEDLAEGEEALAAGERVDADRLPILLAASGGRAVMVGRRPRVAFLPCGDELSSPGRAPVASQVMEVVGSALAARAREDGAEVELAGPLPDHLETVTAALVAAARQADLVVTVGGASVGERDHAAAALVRAGGRLRFHGLRLRPGTPAFGGNLGAAAVLGLPGNPVAGLTVWELVGRAALSRLMGTAAPVPLEAVLDQASDKAAVRDDRYLRGLVWAEEGALRAGIWQGQNAGMLVPLARTNALVRHPGGVARLEAGSPVQVRLTAAIAAARPPWARA
jgi:molybdopterin molybdotransferase